MGARSKVATSAVVSTPPWCAGRSTEAFGPAINFWTSRLAKAFDVYGRHPAFLRVHGRPVIFVYVADAFTPEDWRAMVRSLEHSRRKIFLMTDSCLERVVSQDVATDVPTSN